MPALNHRIAALVRRQPKLIQGLYYLYRFLQPKYTMGVVGIVFNPAGEVLLVEHVYHPRLPWGLPGGWVGYNENPEDAVLRELHEELGIHARLERLIHLERTQFHHLDAAYLCRTTDTVSRLSRELLSYRYVAPADLPRMHAFHYRAIMQACHQEVP